MEILTTWLLFFVLAGVIGVAGYFLSVNADEIADKTGLGKNLVGIIMLGTVTSLPELMTGVSAVYITDSPNLALGDIFGSCVFNLFLVFFLDLAYRESSIFSKATQGQLITGAFGIILLAFVAFSLGISRLFHLPEFFGAGIPSYLIPILYLMAMRTMFKFEKSHSPHQDLFTKKRDQSIRKNVVVFAISAAVIVVTGVLLPFMGEKIMHVMGWEASFVGTIFVAFATSLPEIAVTLSALRLNAVDMAFSNLLGSNIFNMVMLAVDDFAYRKGQIMEVADPSHILTIMTSIMMTGVVIMGFINPPKRRFMSAVSRLSLIILLLFVVNCFVIYNT